MVIEEFTTESGVRVRICDDYMAPKGSEAERRAIEEQRRVAHQILVSAARRKVAESNNDSTPTFTPKTTIQTSTTENNQTQKP